TSSEHPTQSQRGDATKCIGASGHAPVNRYSGRCVGSRHGSVAKPQPVPTAIHNVVLATSPATCLFYIKQKARQSSPSLPNNASSSVIPRLPGKEFFKSLFLTTRLFRIGRIRCWSSIIGLRRVCRRSCCRPVCLCRIR